MANWISNKSHTKREEKKKKKEQRGKVSEYLKINTLLNQRNGITKEVIGIGKIRHHLNSQSTSQSHYN